METFLEEIARTLKKEHPNDLDQVTVVFNNRRSGLFLSRQFAQMSEQPTFLPRIIGIDELISELGGLEIIPNEFLLFNLFDIHQRLDSDERKYSTFEEFISLADMMLADFSEIDLYCVDAKQLFSNLKDIKEIGEWNIETGSLTDFQKHYLSFYTSLYQYYTQLHSILAKDKKAYSGMAYRYVAENIEKLNLKDTPKQIYFVGFNALSTSEQIIISHFIKNGVGKLICDGDAYYYDNPTQEAGHFLRKHHSDFPDIGNFENHFTQSHKNITITSCPENILQAKYAGQIVQQCIHDSSNEQTAIILADESLLIPVVNALPNEISAANITMGYPFSNTNSYTLMLEIISLQQHRKKENYYYQDILAILSNQCISNYLGINDLQAKIATLLAKDHIIYINKNELFKRCQEKEVQLGPIEFLFPNEQPSINALLNMACQLLKDINRANCFKHNEKEREASACLMQIVNYFLELQKKFNFIHDANTLLKIYNRLAKRRTVPFYGEPLQGLQILGVLETRNLDFSRVILLSANEGILPSGKSSNTLIPFNLKKHFNIPTFHDKDAVYAYNFYRLLQRATDVHIIYHEESNGIGKGEASRFVLQVRDELAKQYPNNISLHETIVSASNNAVKTFSKDYRPKDCRIMSILNDIANFGLSPSSLNKYRKCPLCFYYENILHIADLGEINEELEQTELGTCIHKALEQIYSETSDGNILSQTLQNALENIDSILDKAFENSFQNGRCETGRNHFLKSIAKMQIANLLRKEIKQINNNGPIQIIALEKELEKNISVPIGNTSVKVKIRGFADRIDKVNGITRVIDYKSGKVNKKDLEVDEPEPDPFTVPDKWFQVMLYSWLYCETIQPNEQLISGIYPLSHLQSTLEPATWEKQTIISAQHIDTMDSIINTILSELMNPEIPFRPNKDSTNCKLCPMHESCEKCFH